MKIDRRAIGAGLDRRKDRADRLFQCITLIYGALLVATLLAGCDSSTKSATLPSLPSLMTSQPAESPGTGYPASTGYPAPGNPASTAYPAPTNTS
jgi:hypothetical protein